MPRYIVSSVSVGAGGLTERPSVYDTQERRSVKVFRSNERHLAERLAAELEREADRADRTARMNALHTGTYRAGE